MELIDVCLHGYLTGYHKEDRELYLMDNSLNGYCTIWTPGVPQGSVLGPIALIILLMTLKKTSGLV